MRLLCSLLFVSVVVACTGGRDGTGTSSGGSSGDGGSGGSSSSSSSSGGATSSSGGSSSGASSSGSGSASTCPGGTMSVLVKYGQTSSCSHPLPASVGSERDNLNVYYSPSPGVVEKLCRTDRTSCERFKGWFFIGEEIAFCDETCAKIDEGPSSQFLVETGCPMEWCF